MPSRWTKYLIFLILWQLHHLIHSGKLHSVLTLVKNCANVTFNYIKYPMYILTYLMHAFKTSFYQIFEFLISTNLICH